MYARLLSLALAIPLALAVVGGPIPPFPAPSPTPAWHTIGTWSGMQPELFASVHVIGQTRIVWTCQLPGNGGATSWYAGWMMSVRDGGGVGGDWCDATNQGGIFGPFDCEGSCNLYQCTSCYGPDDPGGPWTAVVQAYY